MPPTETMITTDQSQMRHFPFFSSTFRRPKYPLIADRDRRSGTNISSVLTIRVTAHDLHDTTHFTLAAHPLPLSSSQTNTNNLRDLSSTEASENNHSKNHIINQHPSCPPRALPSLHLPLRYRKRTSTLNHFGYEGTRDMLGIAQSFTR